MVILHIDMDAFFAAVEVRDNPALAGKPVIIGADPKGGRGRGVVSTCSYEARKFGVHSAMPISEAFHKCPKGIFLSPDMQKYHQVSEQIFQILTHFTPDIEPISVDEAFLDITGSYHLWKTPMAVGQAIRQQIKQEMHLTASVGIGPSKMVAKIASDECKPDGLLEIVPDKVLDFLWPLSIKKIWGVGPKTEQIINRSGFYTIGDLAKSKAEFLFSVLGEQGLALYELAHGRDDRRVIVDHETKSVSHEYTFEQDTKEHAVLDKTLSMLSEKVSFRLRQYNLKGKTISIKIRTSDFKTFTRAETLGQRTNFFDDIYKVASQLLKEFYQRAVVIRLIGMRVSNFDEEFVQDSLFTDPQTEKKEQIHQALDRIKIKFGEDAIHRG